MTFPVLSAGTSAYNLQRSLRFRSSASAYLNRTPASASNRRTWTWSAWVKRGTFANNYSALFSAGADVNNFNELRFTDLNSGVFDFTFVTGGADTARITTTPVYRDPSAWYHVVVALDTTQATAANRVKIYVNGVQVTSLTTATYPTQNSTWYVNAANAHGLGATVAVGRYFDGYLTEVNFIDGQALTPSSFGSTINRKNLLPEYKSGRNLTRVNRSSTFEDMDEENESKINQISRLIHYLKCLPVKLISKDSK